MQAVQHVAELGVQLILLLSALITKYSPHWALEPEPLNFSAYRKSPRDVLFLRRLLLLEVSAMGLRFCTKDGLSLRRLRVSESVSWESRCRLLLGRMVLLKAVSGAKPLQLICNVPLLDTGVHAAGVRVLHSV